MSKHTYIHGDAKFTQSALEDDVTKRRERTSGMNECAIYRKRYERVLRAAYVYDLALFLGDEDFDVLFLAAFRTMHFLLSDAFALTTTTMTTYANPNAVDHPRRERYARNAREDVARRRYHLFLCVRF